MVRKKKIKQEKKYYKRWHEYSESEAPDSKPHFFAGYVTPPEELKKLINGEKKDSKKIKKNK